MTDDMSNEPRATGEDEDRPLEPVLRDALRAAAPLAEPNWASLHDHVMARIRPSFLARRERVHWYEPAARWSRTMIPLALAAGIGLLALTLASRRLNQNLSTIADRPVDGETTLYSATIDRSSDPLMERYAPPLRDTLLSAALTR